MKTKAIRFYGNKLKLETFDLPNIKYDEILAHVVADTLCLSTYKAILQGTSHARIPHDVAENPVMIGHEFCGEILEVGEKWKEKYKVGQRFVIQPALNYKGSLFAPGYSYQFIGGSATHIIIPNEVMEMDCLLEYNGDTYFSGCLAEPLSCIVGGFNLMFHTTPGCYEHKMGIKEGGNLIILGGAGPMGIGTIDYAINCEKKPQLIVVVDNVEEKINRAQSIVSSERAKAHGVKLVYINVDGIDDQVSLLMKESGGRGYDDVFLYAAIRPLVELGDKVLARDGCMNLFAGPYNKDFMSEINFYNVHYNSTHMVGLSGGTIADMRAYLIMASEGKMNPSVLITHIGGLNSVIETVSNLPKVPGGKKLIYTNIDLELTAIEDFEEKGKTNLLFNGLDKIVKKHNYLWTKEAEDYLLANANLI